MAALVERAFFQDRENRVLTIAVVASIGLHIALLLALPTLRDAKQRRAEVIEPTVARLVEPSAKPAPAAAPPAPDAKNRAAAPAPPPVTSEAKEAVSKPAPPQSVRHQEKPAAKPVPRPLAVKPTPDETDSHAPARSSIQAQPVPAASDAPDAGTLAQYRLAVISAAKRYKRYPRLALENNWQGKVEVRLSISADGSISGLSVRSSTGHSLLDEQALDMIERAKAAAQIPAALRGKQFVVDVPVEFTLREPGA